MLKRTILTRAAHAMRRRNMWQASFVLVLVLIAMGAYGIGGLAPADAYSPRMPHDPAMHSFVEYLRAHTNARTPLPVSTPADPAQQAVMDYVRVHFTPTPQPSSLWDAAAQSVREYLRAHNP
ncbi:hypothetical protein SE17_43075 [Kouleothrix aurantiaca]|uniref:Uncharacterized protein n=1 Tax=Kouleothrix aurantiaca TaxID=186479 RepID=A0A0P9CLQ4_9CHLR|nr:hypothetical protein SE17_43075 [Kouleothrix aurantiaca]